MRVYAKFSLLHPKKYKYVLNDNNHLIELYKIASDETKLNDLIDKLDALIVDITKSVYNELIKKNTLESWIIKNKIYSIKAGLFPSKGTILKTFKYLLNCPIIEFLRNEDITFRNDDCISVYQDYKDDENAFIFLDPPYLSSCNEFYSCPSLEIYNFLNENSIKNEKSVVCLCLEKNWIIDLLFKNYIINEYKKKYENSKKKTKHIIIISKDFI